MSANVRKFKVNDVVVCLRGKYAGRVAKVTVVCNEKFAVDVDSHNKCVHKFSNWKHQKASVLPKSVPVHVKTVKKTNVVAKSNSAATRASTVSTVPGPRLVSGIHSSNPTLLPDLTYAFPSGDDTSTGESWLIKFTFGCYRKGS
jgi:ribosomal protein L24